LLVEVVEVLMKCQTSGRVVAEALEDIGQVREQVAVGLLLNLN
jgi:hypothetical protein